MSLTWSSSVEWAALLVSLGSLLAASLSDLRTREVSNRLWLFYGPLAILLFIIRIALSPENLFILVASAGTTIVVAFLLFQLGVMGGADSKALMCLGLALPVPPGIMAPFWQAPITLYPFPIAVLTNSFLLSITSAIFILLRNLAQRVSLGKRLFLGFEKESVLRKLLILLTSYKTSFNILQSRSYLYPAEQVDLVGSTPVRHFRLVSSAEEEREKLVSGLEGYKAQGLFSDGIWVTPGLPHIVFVTASLTVTLLFGDLLMWMFFGVVGYS